MHATKNVQSLLREAKQEMLIDAIDFIQIQVSGDDLTMKLTQKKDSIFMENRISRRAG
jgi:hypothetical protein